MAQDIHTLLIRFGLTELLSHQHLKWAYEDGEDQGSAVAHFDEDYENLSIELCHDYINDDMLDDDFGVPALEIISIRATRIGDSDDFKITYLNIDGTEHDSSNDGMLVLAAGYYYARALKISDRMLAQSFLTAHSKADTKMLERESRQKLIDDLVSSAEASSGEVVAFRVPGVTKTRRTAYTR